MFKLFEMTLGANHSIIQLLNRLWCHLNKRHQKQFRLLLLLMLLTSFTEIISIGAVLPFLAVLIRPENFFQLPAAQPIIFSLNLTEPQQLLLPLTIIFGLAALIAGAARLLLLWTITRFSFSVGAELSINMYRRTLYQPYAIHCARNSSEVINGISNKANGVIYEIISPAIMLISSGFMLTAIFISLLVIDPVIAIAMFGGFGLIYLMIIRLTSKQLLANSICMATQSNNVIKSLQEGLGGIRDVLIDGSQETYCQIYRNADIPRRRAQGNNMFIGSSPRYSMEALGMLLIAILIYGLSFRADGIAYAIPVLGTLALGAQRLLPVLQQAYGSWTLINSGQASLKDTLELLDQPLPSYFEQCISQQLTFNDCIILKGLSFRYDDKAPFVLRQVNLKIAKGSRIGFIGPTGCGKSTLLDIIMGLLQPTEGYLGIDQQIVTPINQRDWQNRIAHVPQVIFLADSTVEENIAFGVPKDQIDSTRVRVAAQQAQISESIESWPRKYQTIVGERGVRLSGGQRQRIGIARALYKQADVIIFDEATSALDSQTEKEVMDAIEGLGANLTILMVAHRIGTLKNCTKIVTLDNGVIKSINSYKDVLANQLS